MSNPISSINNNPSKDSLVPLRISSTGKQTSLFDRTIQRKLTVHFYSDDPNVYGSGKWTDTNCNGKLDSGDEFYFHPSFSKSVYLFNATNGNLITPQSNNNHNHSLSKSNISRFKDAIAKNSKRLRFNTCKFTKIQND